MSLAGRCRHNFDQRSWQRGEEYFRSGCVSITDVGESWLDAKVKGSTRLPYDVRLEWPDVDEGVLQANCSCPRFSEGYDCKHIAATILATAAVHGDSLIPGRGKLTLEPLDLDSDESSGGEFEDDEFEDDEDMDDDDEDTWDASSRGSLAAGGLPALGSISQDKKTNGGRRAAQKHIASRPNWKHLLGKLQAAQRALELSRLATVGSAPAQLQQVWYILDLQQSKVRGLPLVSLKQRKIKKNGTPGKLTNLRLARSDIETLAAAEDRALVGLLLGNEIDDGYASYYHDDGGEEYSGVFIAPSLFDTMLPKLCASGRFGWRDERQATDRDLIHPLAWDDGPPWEVRLHVGRSTDGRNWQISGRLVRGDSEAELSVPLLLMMHGLVIFPDHIARLQAAEEFPWVVLLRETGPLQIPIAQQDDLVEQLAQLPILPRLDWPAELRWEEQPVVPQPQLSIDAPRRGAWRDDLACRLSFSYGDWKVPSGERKMARFDRQTRHVTRRDLKAESAAAAQLGRLGVRREMSWNSDVPPVFRLNAKKLPQVAAELTLAGWQVEAEGRVIRRPGSVKISVSSGVDWFDVEATCDFDGVSASLPKLLAALKRGEQYVELGDGSQGILPAKWLEKYAPLAELGQVEGDQLRFVPNQAALLDALLAAQESQQVTVDERFGQLRDRLQSFQGVTPRREPPTFVGELRNYQREGLGWLHFLNEFGFGGCLADDMGLGKTVQVLALLDQRRANRPPSGEPPNANGQRSRSKSQPSASAAAPALSLIVVPRSLVFNWVEEAKRFTPKLRVLNYTGLARRDVLKDLSQYDLVVTTYGTLRRDVAELREMEFDYVILDEAQAIKNANSQATKACRLVRGRHRLAMTGTPVENHLGELWSLMEFLNPGMLGRSNKLTDLFLSGHNGRAPGKENEQRRESVALLARAVRPFLLRRTKQQVLTELPPKSEQTLHCELDKKQRQLYDELRDHYRQSLQARIEKVGVNKAKIHVLEALLRLRQAACHPGLLDKKQIDGPSAKLETLLEQLSEVLDEGHKALVFSQFTSLLAIVRQHLDRRGIVYEYLDGRTAKRQEKVERFQTDPKCPLFLISLKAGGQGLNLTAADYVFILDPWWNPAVEAQAVDRAHRIGQQRHVFAYRLIARDTVEEKILELQQHKRGLADAIVSADNSLLRSLTAEDLQLLLS
ncbi:MAG: DEAD/DEAH box helicase [Planctomycetia bacterium]|nr:DEAD/DEAH box helicase [Planctomycetia bacterium]